MSEKEAKKVIAKYAIWWLDGLLHLAIFGMVVTILTFFMQEFFDYSAGFEYMILNVCLYLLIFFVGIPLTFGFIHWKFIEEILKQSKKAEKEAENQVGEKKK